MLKKLVKYDLKWSMKVISIFLTIGIVFAVLGRLLDLIPDSILFSIISQIFKGIGLSMLITAVFNVVIRSWVRIILNLYKDESYLTHTLPIKRETHYVSKVISTLLSIIITIFTLLIGLIIMYYNENTIQMIIDSLNIISTSLNSSPELFILMISLLITLQIIFIIFVGNFGIVLGHTFNQNKTLKSVIFGFVTYMVSMVVPLIVILILSIFNQGIAGLLFGGNTQIDFNSLLLIIWVTIFIYTIFNIVLFILTKKIFSKGINID